MFDSIGWGEIFFILIVGLIVIGPERLPGVIEDIRAALFAARRAINNAKAELNGEMGDLGAEFDQLRQPLSQIASLRGMGPKGALTKALFDGDATYVDSLDPRTIMEEQAQAAPQQPTDTGQPPQHKPQFSWDDVI